MALSRIRRLGLLAAVVAGLAWASPVAARTWHVEKDGSGDFTTIQPAVDGASPGDTIRIGPGHYTEHQPFSPSGAWTRETYLAVTVDDLTIIGADRDSVIIGPDEADFVDFGPKGIVTSYYIGGVSVSAVTLRNVYDGIFTFVDTRAESCAFFGCGYGVTAQCVGAAYATNCMFVGTKYGGIFAHSPTAVCEVVGSQFSGSPYGISAAGVPELMVRGCEFVAGAVGVQFAQGTNGAISGCRVNNATVVGYAIKTGSAGTITESVVDGGQVSILCESESVVAGSHNVLRGATYAAMLISNGSVSLRDCDILGGGGRLVQLELFAEAPDAKMDLRNNYWGFASRDTIAELIWDGNDDPAIHAFVDFEPFSPTRLPNESRSLGGVKRLYR